MAREPWFSEHVRGAIRWFDGDRPRLGAKDFVVGCRTMASNDKLELQNV